MCQVPSSQNKPVDRPHKRECLRCAGDMTHGQKRRQDFDIQQDERNAAELDAVYAHVRALVAGEVGDIRHALVGLLPECQFASDELRAKLPNLAARQDQLAQAAWAKYGYGEVSDG